MGLTRYYLPELAHGDYNFSAEEARHITGAKRQRVGDIFEAFDGKGNYQKLKIIELKSRRLLVEPVADIKYVSKKHPEIEIAVAVPKGKRLQYMIEKLTEIGVSSIVPVVFERSVAGGNDPEEKYKRWAIEACKQSRNSWLPLFSKPITFADYIMNTDKRIIMADYTGKSILAFFNENKFSFNECCCLVGPEGGFSCEEFELAESKGVNKVKLAQNILRIETAAVLFAGSIMALCE